MFESKVWHRQVINGVAIVGSILLAFAIDAWWDERKLMLSAHSRIQSVGQELEVISGRLERSIRMAQVAEEAATVWLERAPDLPPQTLNSLLGDMVMWATSDVSSPSLQALINSNAVDLVEDAELRDWVLSFPTEVQDFVEEENGSVSFIDSAFIPYLAEHAVSIGNADPLEMGFSGRAPPEQVAVLIGDWGFETLVVWRATKARDVVDSANALKSVIAKGQELIRRTD